MEKTRNAIKILVGTHEGNTPHGRQWSRVDRRIID
jgi:hypothetical protein